MLKPSKMDRQFYGCPRCGWPLDPALDDGSQGVYCACGAWVPLPDDPYPQAYYARQIARRILSKQAS